MTASAPDLGGLTQVQRADVYKQGRLAAHLTRIGDAVEFRYTSEWRTAGGPPVATTLPIDSGPSMTVGGAVPAYFAGLLPEGRRLTALRRGVKTSADDELTLVMAIGGDAIGDVQVVPEGQPPETIAPLLHVDGFHGARFQTLLDESEIRIDRVGIPGVQDKVSLAMVNLPVATAAGKFILKLNPPEFPFLVENEHFFLEAARRSGLEVVEDSLVRDAEGVPGLVVRRFDRVVDRAGKEVALAVEDGCQVLGLHPEAKYRVTAEDLFGKLAELSEAPLPAARALLTQQVFVYVSGNGDAHAKNFSVLQDVTGRWRPTPAYDLPSSQPFGDNTLALTVGGKRDGTIPGKRFVALGVHLGLPERAARRVVDDVAKRVDDWIDDLPNLPYDSGRLKKLKAVVLHRRQLLLEQ